MSDELRMRTEVRSVERYIQRWMWRLVAVLVLLLFITLFIGWFNDHASCVRGNSVRKGLSALSSIEYQAGIALLSRADKDTGITQVLDIKLGETRIREAQLLHVSLLSCSTLFPDVNKSTSNSSN